jgi:biopolymer transport protein ExbB/TolQ
MLGFLGTVIGITAALDNLDLNTITESSKKLSAGLAVAFDTTGLAIALDVLLFFVLFLVQREESNLLSETDQQTEMELCGRFEQSDTQEEENQIVAFHRTLETICTSIEQMAKRQTEIWEQSADTFKISLASALKEGMDHHAKSLVKAESELLSQANRTTIQFNEAFSKSAATLLALREETSRQTETVREIMGTKSQLVQLEAGLQKNLSTLASVGNFEETVNSLAAAIHLLNNNRRNELRAG